MAPSAPIPPTILNAAPAADPAPLAGSETPWDARAWGSPWIDDGAPALCRFTEAAWLAAVQRYGGKHRLGELTSDAAVTNAQLSTSRIRGSLTYFTT